MQNLTTIDLSLLLNREEVKLNIEAISKRIENKIFLVTGAGGSIGSEICRQICTMNPKKLILLGRGENSIYQINKELTELYGTSIEIIPVIADIQDKKRLEQVFSKYRPNIVYHAAAYKHVPLMQDNPEGAFFNNVIGTDNLVTISSKYEVENFVMISTDKAVKPVSVMGATKRLSELIVQSMNTVSKTKFSIVRFGNVLGSRGSVIPLFLEQISKGKPITLTDKRMTRYFMTIPEASKLVLQASAFANGGEIFILDMGEPVKIIDLAKQLIELTGHTEEEIKIVEVGIRPGEKLYEELMSSHEKSDDTILPKTFVSTNEAPTRSEVLTFILNVLHSKEGELRERLIEAANKY